MVPPANSDDSHHAPDPEVDASLPREHTETVLYRRAPKLPVFLILGGALGAITGMFVGVFGAGNAMFTTGQVIGYMIAIFALLGFSVGAVVALIFDRFSLRRAQKLQAQVEEHKKAPNVRD